MMTERGIALAAEVARLTADLAAKRREMREVGVDMRGLVIAAYKANPRVKDITEQFGVSRNQLWCWRRWYERETGEKLPRALWAAGSARQPWRGVRRDNAAIVAAVAECGSLSEVGRRFGLTRERIRQIVSRHENEIGQRLARYNQGQKPRLPLVEWTCERCGRSWKTRRGIVGKCKSDCSRGSSKRGLEFIELRRAGLSWTAIAAKAGLAQHCTGNIQGVVWRTLRFRAPEQIPEIFGPRARLTYFQKRWPLSINALDCAA